MSSHLSILLRLYRLLEVVVEYSTMKGGILGNMKRMCKRAQTCSRFEARMVIAIIGSQSRNSIPKLCLITETRNEVWIGLLYYLKNGSALRLVFQKFKIIRIPLWQFMVE